jgi:hypothetical protein
MSSAFSYLDNQNRKLSRTVTVPAVQGSTTSFMVTVYPWTSFSRVDKITLNTSAAPGSAATALTVVSDGAGWRLAGSTANKAPYILGTSSVSVTNNIAEYTFSGGLFCKDTYRVNCLYLNFANSTFATGDTFTVKVEGVQTAPVELADNDTTPFIYDNSWRVLRVDGSGVCTDITQKMMRNGNPYGLGSTLENSESFLTFDTSADTLYVGSTRKFNGMMVYVPSYSQNNTRATFSYSTGIGFTTFTGTSIQDNTGAGMGVTTSLCYSGVIKIANWAAGAGTSTLSFDPLTALKLQYDNFNLNIPRPGGFFMHPERYWVRMTFASITPGDIKLCGIMPIL